jgi:hypothetical protein
MIDGASWDQAEGTAGDGVSLIGKLGPVSAFSQATEFAELTIDPPPAT